MNSLLTNMSAMSALRSLSTTESQLAGVQSQISSGLAVETAADNASYWSIATTMRSDNGALGAVSSSLDLAAATLGVTNAAMTNIISVMDNIKNTLVTADSPTTDFKKIQTAISSYQQQLVSFASSASFNGENMLSIDSASPTFAPTQTFISTFSRDTSGGLTIGTIGIDIIDSPGGTVTGTALYDAVPGSGNGILDTVDATTGVSIATIDVSGFDTSTAFQTSLQNLITQVDQAIQSITSANSTLGASQTRVSLQSSFVSNLSDAIASGIGALVDADMNEASTRLQALQVQQQLGIQALGIANQNSQLILKLFQ